MVKQGKSYHAGLEKGYEEGWHDALDTLDRVLIGMLYQSEIGLVPEVMRIEDVLSLVKKVRSE